MKTVQNCKVCVHTQATVDTAIKISDFLERHQAVRYGGLTEEERTFCSKMIPLRFADGVYRIKVFVRLNSNVSLIQLSFADQVLAYLIVKISALSILNCNCTIPLSSKISTPTL